MTFYFAWVDAAEAFSAPTHSREDENVFAFELTHSEGNFAILAITIRSPRTNLIAPSRKVWAWLSEDGVPIFKGRLIASPEEINKELVRLNFIARSADFVARKTTLADTLKVFPWWDPIWVNEQRLEDLDVVLEARAELWHIDRISHDVTVSSITTGEDGVVTFTHFYDSLKMSYGSTPLRQVTVNASVQWDQTANGEVDFTRDILDVFKLAGSPPYFVSSYTGQGLQGDWPKPLTNMRAGWGTGNLIVERVDGIIRPARSKNVTILNDSSGDPLTVPATAQFFVWEFKIEFPLTYDVSRHRIENITFTLESDVQPLVTDPGEDESEIINLSSQAVGEGDTPPIGDLRRSSYMITDRGLKSFEYLIMLARAKLLARARAVEISISVPFADGLNLSCRKDGIVNDPRLPGGTARGKIIEYKLIATGSGVRRCDVVIGATIGEGNSVSAVVGDPLYVEEGYVDQGYQLYSGSTVSIGDVTYEDYRSTEIDDDGVNFFDMRSKELTTKLQVFNGEREQAQAIDHAFSDIPAAIEALNAKFTEVLLELKPLTGGPFETDFDVDVSRLMIPKTMEL